MRSEGQLIVKRLIRDPNAGWLIQSDNPRQRDTSTTSTSTTHWDSASPPLVHRRSNIVLDDQLRSLATATVPRPRQPVGPLLHLDR